MYIFFISLILTEAQFDTWTTAQVPLGRSGNPDSNHSRVNKTQHPLTFHEVVTPAESSGPGPINWQRMEPGQSVRTAGHIRTVQIPDTPLPSSLYRKIHIRILTSEASWAWPPPLLFYRTQTYNISHLSKEEPRGRWKSPVLSILFLKKIYNYIMKFIPIFKIMTNLIFPE